MCEKVELSDKIAESVDEYARKLAWEHKQNIDRATAIAQGIAAANEYERKYRYLQRAAKEGEVSTNNRGSVILGDGPEGVIILDPSAAMDLASDLEERARTAFHEREAGEETGKVRTCEGEN